MINFKLPLALFAGATLLAAPAIANPPEEAPAPAEQQQPGAPAPEAPAPQQPEEGAPTQPQG